MATFNEIATLISEQMGRVLDDPFKEMLKARAKYWRSKLLRDTLNKNPKDRIFFTQSITLGTEEVSALDCSIPLDCKVGRTVNIIPKPVRANNILFDFVGSADGFTPFKRLNRYELQFKLTDKYSTLVTQYYAFENGKIVFPKNRMIQKVRIDAIFDDPDAAWALNCDGSTNCNFDDAEYPVSGDIAQQIIQYILQVDFAKGADDNDESIVNVQNNGNDSPKK